MHLTEMCRIFSLCVHAVNLLLSRLCLCWSSCFHTFSAGGVLSFLQVYNLNKDNQAEGCKLFLPFNVGLRDKELVAYCCLYVQPQKYNPARLLFAGAQWFCFVSMHFFLIFNLDNGYQN